jgi:hypothetical protein
MLGIREMCGKVLIQEREEAIAPQWHGKIHRTDNGKRKWNEGMCE